MKFAVFLSILFVNSLCSKKFWFLETFDSNFESKWIQNEKYDGVFIWDEENGKLIIPEKKKNYGMIRIIDPPIDNEGKNLIFQYEVRFSKPVECGAAYLKLIFDGIEDPKDFSEETLFAVMFGPDKCRFDGKKDQIQFIFNHHNEKCDFWEKKHVERPPKIVNDIKTHLYTLIIRTDNTFEIYVDLELVKSGSFFKHFNPSVVPPMFFKKNDPRLTKPRNVKNKCYYEPEHPYKFNLIGAVGIDIYSGYSENISIDNILVTWDEEYSKKLAEYTWGRAKEIENYKRPFHYDDDFNVVYDGPEKLEFEKDFDYNEL